MADKNNGSNVAPETVASAKINGLVTMYDRSGTESYWRLEDLPQAEAAGLTTTKFDVDEAFAEWDANHEARAQTVREAVAEMKRNGYIQDEVWDAFNQAMGYELDAYRNLALALGARLPSESHVAALAEHKRLRGSLNGLLFQKQYEAAVDAMPADRVKHHKDRAAKADAQAHANIRKGIAEGLVSAPEGWVD